MNVIDELFISALYEGGKEFRYGEEGKNRGARQVKEPQLTVYQ